MCRFIFTLCICFSLTTLAQPQRSFKRGVGESGFSKTEEINALSPGVSWTYNWSITPSSSVANDIGPETKMEFVPMCWNTSFSELNLRTYLIAHPGVKYLLGYNEPNFANSGGSNITPIDAATNWSKVEQIAADFNLKLIAPALNYPNGPISDGNTYSPEQWMDAFIAAYKNLNGKEPRMDYMALHSYMNSSTALMNFIDNFSVKYGKQIWLTEFCSWEGTVDSVAQLNAMVQKVQSLELDNNVARYAWFKAKGSTTSPYYQLLLTPKLSESPKVYGRLSNLGKVYVNMSSFDLNYYYKPSTPIPAKEYINSGGISLQPNSDVESTQNIQISSFDNGAFTEYLIDIPQTQEYDVQLRFSSEAFLYSPQIQLSLDGQPVATQILPETGMTDDTDQWATATIKAVIPAGKHRLQVKSTRSTTCKLNWLQLDTTTGINDVSNAAGTSRSKKYYTIDGCETKNLRHGVYIEKNTLDNGKTVVRKITR